MLIIFDDRCGPEIRSLRNELFVSDFSRFYSPVMGFDVNEIYVFLLLKKIFCLNVNKHLKQLFND